MNKDTIEFLKELQHEMLTQDTVCQADPRFWVVKHKVRVYGIDYEFDFDGREVVCNGEIVASNLSELYDYLEDHHEEYSMTFDNEHVVINTNQDDEHLIDSMEELLDFMYEELGYLKDEVYLAHYRDEYRIVENTMFLTLRECKEHIKANSYHYREPHPYAMTAWRSPQVEKLFKIIQETDWSL